MSKLVISGLLGAALLLSASVSLAQTHQSTDDTLWFNPELSSDLASPGNFDGLYAGISVGLANNNFNTFYTSTTNSYRVPASVIVGYNTRVKPWLLAGVELQGEVAVDWTNAAYDFRVMGLGRIGYLLADNFAIYQMAGFGLINGRSAYAIGISFEQAVSKNLAVRTEALAYGQFNPPAGVTDYGGFTLMKLAVGALWRFGDDPGPDMSYLPYAGVLETTDFTGPYLGAYMGMQANPQYNFFVLDPLKGLHLSRASQGALAGWNFSVGENIRAGAEVQAGINYNTSGGVGWDTQALARVGVIPTQGLLVYGSAGVGMLADRAAYSVGAGVEYALWGKNTLRLDAQLIGEISPAPPVVAPGFTAGKITVGTLWHLR